MSSGSMRNVDAVPVGQAQSASLSAHEPGCRGRPRRSSLLYAWSTEIARGPESRVLWCRVCTYGGVPSTTETIMRPYSRFLFAMTVFTAPTMAACWFHEQASGTKWPMTGSARAPAASGEIAVSDGPNGNTRLKIRVHHLAPAQRIAREATGYVAWVVPYHGTNRAASTEQQSGDGEQSNIGAIQLDPDLNGTLNTLTALRHFDVSITPEASPSATQPSNPPVLTASIR